MELARGVTIHLPDRYTRYDITPYATHYDAVAAAVGFTSEWIPVLTAALSF